MGALGDAPFYSTILAYKLDILCIHYLLLKSKRGES